MDVINFLQNQMANINTNFHHIAGDITEQEWLARPAPGHNMLGFTVWHIPRTQDTHVQTWVRGIPQVAHGERWAQWRQLMRPCIGHVHRHLGEVQALIEVLRS